MPSSSQEITCNGITEQSSNFPPGINADKRLAYDLRDFLGPLDAVPIDNGRSSALEESLPYIDEQLETEDSSERSYDVKDVNKCTTRETEEVLNHAACRLRRWRASSRKLHRARVTHNYSGNTKTTGILVERLRGLTMGTVVSSAEELLSLAPPPPAATAPPSPGCLVSPNLADQTSVSYFGSSPECSTDAILEGFAEGSPAPPPGPRYKLATEGSMRICSFQHTKTVVDKLFASKFLPRRWETHVLCLHEEQIVSKTPGGLLERPLEYNGMQVFIIARWDTASKYCLRLMMPNSSQLLIQATDAYTRDQWYHSIIWRRNMIRYRSMLSKSLKKDIVIKELKNMVDFAMTTPLQDEVVTRAPLQMITRLLSEQQDQDDWAEWAEAVTSVAAPLLAERCASDELCNLLAKLCREHPRAVPLPALAPPVRRVITRNVDFAKTPHARQLVADYISALSAQSSGAALVRRFVEVTHGKSGLCPHPRAAPNLAAVSLAVLDQHYRNSPFPHVCDETEDDVICFASILDYMSDYEDWIFTVSGLLQPVPLCAGALGCPRVARHLSNILTKTAKDSRCAVHSHIFSTNTVRANPPSWLKVAAPSHHLLGLQQNELCQLWGDMLQGLLSCCCRLKSFLQSISKQLPDILLVALTGHPAALDALSLILEWEVTSGEQTQLEIIAALQATDVGMEFYKELCERQHNLEKLQSEGGPRQLALPVRATDADVAALLESGTFGNLECLSLAFTSVTSACAHHLIKLRSLRYLNLWATQFGDSGLQLIAEHLTCLQALNLCETPISDKGIEALSGLSSLRRLNLNSTKLSGDAFETLRKRLPNLQEYDIRYTDAW